MAHGRTVTVQQSGHCTSFGSCGSSFLNVRRLATSARSRHASQNVWRHGSVFGIVKRSVQMLHDSSVRIPSMVGCPPC